MTPRSPGRRRAVTLAAAVTLLGMLAPASAHAHAELDSVTPADGSTVDVAPSEIVMTFTQDLDQSRSSIVVVTAAGAEVASGGAVDAAAPRRMTVALASLEPGAYEVRWTSFSAEDNEIDRGVTTFTFSPPPPTPTPPPSATPAPTTGPTPSLSPSVAPSPSADTTPTNTSTADLLIPIIAAVVLVGGLGYWLLRNRSKSSGTP